jgi:phosphate starvation-inducible PhoH-like protein
MARNSGKMQRSYPAKKERYKPSQEEKSKARRAAKEEDFIPNHSFKEVQPLNFIQGEYLEAIKSNDIIFGIGSAGTGKTYIAANYAASELFHRRVDKVYLTRPNIETGRGLGFLPGTLEEKYAPYLLPFDAILTKALGKGFYEYCLNRRSPKLYARRNENVALAHWKKL